jgi:hypothetical protein
MALFHRLGTWLLVVGLMHIALPARAAEFDKYLLDDTDGVMSVNVKQVLASPLFTKKYQKQVEELLKMGAAQELLKDSGLDPLKDVERLTLVASKSCYQSKGAANNGKVMSSETFFPLVILQGRFDPAKLKTKGEQLAKAGGTVKIHKVGEAQVYEVTIKGTSTAFVAVLDKSSVVVAGSRRHAEDAIEKATGKKKTELKHKAMKTLVDKMDAKQTIAWAACSEMIGETQVSATFDGQNNIVKVKHVTLAEMGIESASGGLIVGATIKGSTALICKDGDTAKAMGTSIQDGLKSGIAETEKLVAKDKQFAPLVVLLKAIKVAAKDKTVNLQGEGGADGIEAIFKLWFMASEGKDLLPPAPAQEAK